MKLKSIQVLVLAAIFFSISVLGNVPSPAIVMAAPNPTIYVYDLSSAHVNSKSSEVYDEEVFISTLQGIINKKGPRFFVYYNLQIAVGFENFFQKNSNDKDIFAELRKAGQWLDGYTVVTLNTIDDVINQFKSEITGIVTWDNKVEATVNIATTIAGIEDAPVVMYGGKLYNKLISSPNSLTIKVNLNGQFSGANAKTDAYYWAKTNYLDNSRVNCRMLSILEDGYARNPERTAPGKYSSSRDYLVMNKAFVFDLSPWSDERPNDAREQTLGGDYNCYTSILQSAQNVWGNKWAMEIIGFIPWWHKYTTVDGKSTTHDPVPSEWKTVQILSSYGASITQVVDTIGSTNASFHSWAPVAAKMLPQDSPSRETIANKTYICYFNGDHDGGTIDAQFNTVWMDPRRGQIPIAWGIVPWMIKDYPSLYNYLRDTATKNDFLWAGASGASYANPGYIDNAVWKKVNEYYYSRAGYTMTGFILNGNAGTVTNSIESMYRDFSGDGIAGTTGQWITPGFDVRNGNVATAMIQANIDSANIDSAATTIYNITTGLPNPGSQPNFVMVRSTFAHPSMLEQINKELLSSYPSYNYQAVDPYTFFSLIRQQKLGQQGYDSVVTDIQWPERMVANEKYDVKVTVRNTGVYTWARSTLYRLGSTASNQFAWSDWQDGGENNQSNYRAYLSTTEFIEAQQTKTFSFKITAPATAGTYNFGCQMVRDGVTWFGSEYTKSIQVVNAGQYEARLTSISAPDEIIEGQTASVSFTFKNIGTSAWTAANDYRLGSLDQHAQNVKAIPNRFEWTNFTNGGISSSVFEGAQRANLAAGDSIAPGQSKTFTFDIIAPYGSGKHVVSARMVRDGYSWFGDEAVKDITVVPSGRSTNYANKVTVTVPSYVSPNEKVNVAVSVRNTGSSTWTKADNFRLGATTNNTFTFTDMRNGGYSNSATDQRIYLSNSDSIKPEETKTFNFSITAPTNAGSYRMSVKMIREGVDWFGDQVDVYINVKGSLDAVFRVNDVPDQVAAGSTFYVNVADVNTGTENWKQSTLHRLGSTNNNQFPFILSSSEGFGTSDGREQRVYLPSGVYIPQGKEYGFFIKVKAPSTPGTYTFEIGMVKDGVSWFGQTLTKSITVVQGYSKCINIGGGALTDEKGVQFLADQVYTSGSWGYTGTTGTLSTTGTISIADQYSGLYGQAAYKTVRTGTSFGYRFDNVPNGTYMIRVLFADHQSTASGQNLVNVSTEGYEAIKALDIYKLRGGTYKALIGNDIMINVSDGVLNVDFTSANGNAFLNGLIVERVN